MTDGQRRYPLLPVGVASMTEQQRIKEAFEAILDYPIEARERMLEQVCANNTAIRAEVEALLDAHAEADGFLAGSPISGFAGDSGIELLFDSAGRRIGAYEL